MENLVSNPRFSYTGNKIRAFLHLPELMFSRYPQIVKNALFSIAFCVRNLKRNLLPVNIDRFAPNFVQMLFSINLTTKKKLGILTQFFDIYGAPCTP